MDKKNIVSKNNKSEKESITPYMIWLDMEMSGLNPEKDVILEIAVVITDNELNIVDQLPSIVINQPNDILAGMDAWNISVHTKSGLITQVQNSETNLLTAENSVLDFIKQYVKKGSAPLCGNTIYQDRKFIIKYMPNLESFLHYRLIDVSTLKELAKRWYPQLPAFEKHNRHEALADVIESIEELKHYRKHFLLPNSSSITHQE